MSTTTTSSLAGAWRGRAARRGVALVQVMCVVAVASVMGLAMLSGETLQVQAVANRTAGMQADVLADSGVNLAAYYIRNPSAAPTLNAEGYWPGGQDISLGADAGGTIDVAVTRSSGVYTVSSVARVGPDLTHAVKVKIRDNPGLRVRHAVSYNNSATVYGNTEIHGDVQCKGSLTIPLLVTIDGRAFLSGLLNLLGLLLGGSERVDKRDIVIPNAYTLYDYRKYSFNGQTYHADAITQSTLGGGTAVTLGPTETNPAGIYYYSYDSTTKSQNLTLAGNVTINGTLIADNAVLVVRGPNNVVTAASGYPAVVAAKDVYLAGASPSLTVRGLVWVGGWVKTSSASSAAMNVSGAIMFAGSGMIDQYFSGRVTVNYSKARVYAPDLDTRYPPGPQLLSWER